MGNLAEKVDALQEAVMTSRNDPAWFVDYMLRQLDDCDDWQIDVLEAIADVFRNLKGEKTRVNKEGRNRISIRSCHGPGKTHLLALILHWWNFCYHGLVVGTAPKQDQIKTRFMPRYRKILRKARKNYRDLITVNVMKINILGDVDWGYIGETASEPENMAGYHDTPQLILVDEASARSLDAMFPVIEGALSTPGSVMVIIGNPTRSNGEFYNSHNKRGTKELYHQVHVKPEISRYVDPKWVKTMIAKYGEDSSVVQVRVLGNFVDQEENQLLALSWLEDARREWVSDGSNYHMRITVDVMDGGEDESVVTVGYIYQTFTVLIKMFRFSFKQSVAPIRTAEEAMKIADQYKYSLERGDDIVVDSIGVGAGTAGVVIKAKDGHGRRKYKVISYKGGTTQGVNTKIYRNQRARCYIGIRDDFRDGTMVIDPGFCDEEDWEEYLAQACSVRTKPGDERVEDIVSKKEQKGNGGKSPDMTDGTAMMKTNQNPHSLSGSPGPLDSKPMGILESANADF